MHQRVVVVAREGELRERLFEALGTFSAEAVEVPSVARAMELARELPIHLLVVRYPLEGMKFSEFLRAFRETGSASRGAQVVVLAPGKSIGGLKRSVKAGVALLNSDSDLEELTSTFTTFLRRSPRFSGNLLIGAELELPAGKVRKMLQVVNISESGMLLRTKSPVGVGDQFNFELQIPDLKSPILGRGEVVRVITEPESGRVPEVGVKIVDFVGKSRESLAKFLKIRRLPPALAQ